MEPEPIFKLKVRATRNGKDFSLPDFARDFGQGLTRRTFTRTDARKTLEAIQAAQLREGKTAYQARPRFGMPPDLIIEQPGGVKYRIFPAPVQAPGANQVYHTY